MSAFPVLEWLLETLLWAFAFNFVLFFMFWGFGELWSRLFE